MKKLTICILGICFTLSCTTNKILRETNENLDRLNTSIDQKFNSLSQPIQEIASSFSEMSKTVNGFSKATEPGGIIDQLNLAFSEVSPQDIKNSVTNAREAMTAFLEISEGIKNVGGVEGIFKRVDNFTLQIALGYMMGIQFMEGLNTITGKGALPKEEIQEYLIAMQNLLEVTNSNTDPAIKATKESIKKLLQLKAEENGIADKLDLAQNLQSELYKAKNSLSYGLSFFNDYKASNLSLDYDGSQDEPYRKTNLALMNDYQNNSKSLLALHKKWNQWIQNQEFEAIE